MARLTSVLFAAILIGVVSTVERSQINEGYSAGFYSDCPGSTKPAIISKESLNYLGIKVIGAKATATSARKTYSYYQMKSMARDPTMNYSRKTVLFVSGYQDNPNFPTARILETCYRNLGYNVWLLDMYKFVTMEYTVVARVAPAVGKHVGEMLYNLTRLNVGFDPKKLEILGLSLGAQTMSFIAKSYKELSGIKIGRLTGLDPIGACFRNLGPEHRLDKEDADFVETVGTNIDGYGIAEPLGHVNFYVNGGEHQAHDVFFVPCEMICSHMRSFTLWYSALQNRNSFIALQCDSVQQARDKDCYSRKPLVTNLLGPNVDKTKHGLFYLATTHTYPYYMGEKGVKRKYEPIYNDLKSLNPEGLKIL
ncbi:lipase member H-A-like [Achroia grisella]|uniref:lipase member H-A-like n=1 Tax=Achroia grisella TaxID=688607 RepID=UPI0027D23BA8|nr:lipase member H-A-like [Achroia grisella]